MKTTVNKLEIQGNLGKDATIFDNKDYKGARFSVAVTDMYRDKEKQLKEKTTWIPVLIWKIDDATAKGLKKGAKVKIEGSLQNSEYVKGKIKLITLEVLARKLIIVKNEPSDLPE